MVHHKRMTNQPQHYAHIHMLAQQHVPLHTTHIEMVTRRMSNEVVATVMSAIPSIQTHSITVVMRVLL